MKLLITGGSGTLGQEITNIALAKKYQVHILSRNKKLISKNMAARIFTWLDNSPSSEIKKTDLIDLPSVYGYAEGKKCNKNFSVGVTFDDNIQNLSMGEATSLPLACGVKMFLDGEISQRGIHAPESGIINPKIFLDYFAREIGDGVELSPLITINEGNNF